MVVTDPDERVLNGGFPRLGEIEEDEVVGVTNGEFPGLVDSVEEGGVEEGVENGEGVEVAGIEDEELEVPNGEDVEVVGIEGDVELGVPNGEGVEVVGIEGDEVVGIELGVENGEGVEVVLKADDVELGIANAEGDEVAVPDADDSWVELTNGEVLDPILLDATELPDPVLPDPTVPNGEGPWVGTIMEELEMVAGVIGLESEFLTGITIPKFNIIIYVPLF